jgi:hypothetical protein
MARGVPRRQVRMVQASPSRGGPFHAARSSRGEQGQALLELALVAPILVLLIMAIFQFAYVLESQIGLTNAVREAGRRVAATSTANPVWADVRTWTLLQLDGDGTPANPGLLPTNVQAYQSTLLWPAPYPGMSNTTTPAVSFCSYPVGGVTNYRVQVDVRYSHPVFFGLLAFATDAIDGTDNGSWDLSASAQIRMENVDPVAVQAGGNDPGACP